MRPLACMDPKELRVRWGTMGYQVIIRKTMDPKELKVRWGTMGYQVIIRKTMDPKELKVRWGAKGYQVIIRKTMDPKEHSVRRGTKGNLVVVRGQMRPRPSQQLRNTLFRLCMCQSLSLQAILSSHSLLYQWLHHLGWWHQHSYLWPVQDQHHLTLFNPMLVVLVVLPPRVKGGWERGGMERQSETKIEEGWM